MFKALCKRSVKGPAPALSHRTSFCTVLLAEVLTKITTIRAVVKRVSFPVLDGGWGGGEWAEGGQATGIT